MKVEEADAIQDWLERKGVSLRDRKAIYAALAERAWAKVGRDVSPAEMAALAKQIDVLVRAQTEAVFRIRPDAEAVAYAILGEAGVDASDVKAARAALMAQAWRDEGFETPPTEQIARVYRVDSKLRTWCYALGIVRTRAGKRATADKEAATAQAAAAQAKPTTPLESALAGWDEEPNE